LIVNKPSIVLVRPQLPENIGMVARVMNNFALKDLIIVNPKQDWLNKKSINAAKKANNIINKAKIYDNLNHALKNFTFVIGTTNRTRYINKTTTNNFTKINQILKSSRKIAILFGPENSGLSNEDIQLSDILFSINTNNNSNSLNLSHAVAITCFKIFELNKDKNINKKITDKNNTVTKGQLSRYFDYLFENLSNKNFFVPKEKTNSMKNNIYNIYSKSSLTKKELQTLWGITKKLTK
tara:strand:+ start:325 stop:1038 length:714 start_codon:yes stop_codon:yes gene_type:complete